MKYKSNISLIIVITVMWLLSGCISSNKKVQVQANNSSLQGQLPQDLMYGGKPISDACMEVLVPILCGSTDNIEIDLDTFTSKDTDNVANEFSAEKDEYEWKYIGTLPNGDHLVYGYLWPAGAHGKFTEIAIIRRVDNKLKAIGYIAGGDRHATMINGDSCFLKGDRLTYYQHMTNGLLYSVIMDQYPELKELAEKKLHAKLHWGEADYLGYGTFEVTITPEGILKNRHLISFTPAEGSFSSDDETKQYYDDWLKNTSKASLAMGDSLLQVLDFYTYKNNLKTLDAKQLKEMMIRTFEYAAEEQA